MIERIVRRTVELHTSADELWDLLADPVELTSWLGSEGEVALWPGGLGRLVDADGTVRRISVDRVEVGRSIGFTWWVDGDESSASTVELTIGDPDGRDDASTLTVIERPLARAGGTTCQLADAAAAWDDRLLGLELSVLSPALLVNA